MTITLKFSTEQEQRLLAGAAQQDEQAVREILRQALDTAVEEILHTSTRRPQSKTLPALLDNLAAELRDAPALSDEAVSRVGIYADHP